MEGAEAGPPDLDETLANLGSRSPALAAALDEARATGWVVQYGVPGGGTFASAKAPIPTITIDPESASDFARLASSLAHELGHAVDDEAVHHFNDQMTREEYVEVNTREMLDGEAEATIMELQVRDELLAGADPVEMPISGATAAAKVALWMRYKAGELTREQLVQQIGDLFATGENPSNDPNITYAEYYAQPFEDGWDAANATP